jgi:hypothetical protein
MLSLYAAQRFLIELTRGDTSRGFVPGDVPIIGGLSTSQAIGIPVFIVAAGLFVWIMVSRPRGVDGPPASSV